MEVAEEDMEVQEGRNSPETALLIWINGHIVYGLNSRTKYKSRSLNITKWAWPIFLPLDLDPYKQFVDQHKANEGCFFLHPIFMSVFWIDGDCQD